ncbi:MAG: YbjN domain-containing protein [Polyangiaceae bacterium]|nr:YbjN domain-containing protein [Polyangiaceae bacterium]
MAGSGGNGTKHNGERALESLAQFLREDGWFPQPLEHGAGFGVMFQGNHGVFRCIAEVVLDFEQFLFYVVLPELVPAERRLAVAEATTRANCGMRIGNFELDFVDGMVRYKSSIDFDEELLTPPLIRNAIYMAVETMDRYAAAIVAVARGEKTAAAAIAEVEASG